MDPSQLVLVFVFGKKKEDFSRATKRVVSVKSGRQQDRPTVEAAGRQVDRMDHKYYVVLFTLFCRF